MTKYCSLEIGLLRHCLNCRYDFSQIGLMNVYNQPFFFIVLFYFLKYWILYFLTSICTRIFLLPTAVPHSYPIFKNISLVFVILPLNHFSLSWSQQWNCGYLSLISILPTFISVNHVYVKIIQSYPSPLFIWHCKGLASFSDLLSFF